MPGCAAPVRVQDPHQADKLAKIQSDLDETKVVLHRTIESMLERGEKLDTLVGKIEDLRMARQMFYKQARRVLLCCPRVTLKRGQTGRAQTLLVTC